MSEEELKNCPFCGDEAEVEPVPLKLGWYYIVRCRNRWCSAQTGLKPSEHDAVKAWNIRDGESE